MLNERTKKGIRNFALFCIWFFLMWLGLGAIDHHEDQILGIYVFLGATGLSTFIGRLWRGGSRSLTFPGVPRAETRSCETWLRKVMKRKGKAANCATDCSSIEPRFVNASLGKGRG